MELHACLTTACERKCFTASHMCSFLVQAEHIAGASHCILCTRLKFSILLCHFWRQLLQSLQGSLCTSTL